MYFNELSTGLQIYVASKVLGIKRELLQWPVLPNREMEKIAYEHICLYKPLSKIFREKYFWKWKFFTDSHTMCPRDSTHGLVELLLESHKEKEKLRFLELGTGTGALSITILKLFKNSTLKTVEICPHAISIAKRNAKRLGVENRLEISQGDWLSGINESFDILVSNPPYLTKSEIERNINTLKYDPIIALDGGPDGIEKYIKISEKRLLFKEIYLEINPKKYRKIKKLFSDFSITKRDSFCLYLKRAG